MLRRSSWKLLAAVGAPLDRVAVSERCRARVTEVNTLREWQPTRPLRLKIVAGGCQGFSYEFAFDPKVDAEKDLVLDAVEGQPIVVMDKKSIAKLQGATIDYHGELKGSAFVVVGNELVDASCACGQSFSMIKAKKAAAAAAKAGAVPTSASPLGNTTNSSGTPSTPAAAAAASSSPQDVAEGEDASPSPPTTSASSSSSGGVKISIGEKLSLRPKPSSS